MQRKWHFSLRKCLSDSSIQSEPNEHTASSVSLTVHSDFIIYKWSLRRWNHRGIDRNQMVSSSNQKIKRRNGTSSYFLFYYYYYIGVFFQNKMLRLFSVFAMLRHIVCVGSNSFAGWDRSTYCGFIRYSSCNNRVNEWVYIEYID